MKKIGDVTNTADKNGEFTNGNISTGTPPTILEGPWLTAIQREILNVLVKAGVVQDPNKDNQLALSIEKIAKSSVPKLAQETGSSEEMVMSQKAVTDAISDSQVNVPDATTEVKGKVMLTNELVNNDSLAITPAGVKGALETTQAKNNENYEMQTYLQSSSNVIDSGTASVVVVGDSITSGVGASTAEDKYVTKFMRSLWNHVDKGLGNDRSFNFESYIEIAQAIKQIGVETTGTVLKNGVVESRLKLTDGQYIEFTLREIGYLDCIYDGELTKGDVDFYVNNKLVRSFTTLKTAGLHSSFPTALLGGKLVGLSDKCRIVAKGGNVVISALLTLRQSARSPFCYVISRSGWGFQSYLDPAKLTEIAFYLNYRNAANKKLLIINLGTNNIYNKDLAVDSDEYIRLLNEFITGIKARSSNVHFVIEVPAKATSRWTALKDNYDLYVAKILEYCKLNKHLVTRFDRETMSLTGDYYDDGLHPNDDGHSMIAMSLCKTLGIQYNPYRRMTEISDPEYLRLLNRPTSGKWLNVTESRSLNTQYKNTSENDLYLSVSTVHIASNLSLKIFVDDDVVYSEEIGGGDTFSKSLNGFTVIPPGSTYKVVATAPLVFWKERS
ncbi:SGNH/GDSL hydrolase family protein [Providencia rettgeri]|uniref:SGNH/GDSL hydrolase family protein n=1 Tax=Providencia rettgeri TaxID=587 RepID=UPI00384F147D